MSPGWGFRTVVAEHHVDAFRPYLAKTCYANASPVTDEISLGFNFRVVVLVTSPPSILHFVTIYNTLLLPLITLLQMALVWKSEQREFTSDGTFFVKRQLRPQELGFPAENLLFCTERIKNEYVTLLLIKEKTKIPVPREIELSVQHDGDDVTCSLRTEYIHGILLEDINEDHRMMAIAEVDRQMEESILPELRKLKSSSLGSADVNLPVFPPNIVLYDKMRTDWPRIESGDDDFVFCHNDLSGHNIIVDERTFEILAILDWEYSGFFPAWFERPLWRVRYNERDDTESQAYVERVTSFFSINK